MKHFLILSLILFTACVNNNEPKGNNTTQKHLPNDISIRMLNGDIKTVTETLFFDVEQVDSDWIPDSTDHLVITYQYNQAGFMTQKTITSIDSLGNPDVTETKYEFENGLPVKGSLYKNNEMLQYTTVKEIDPKTIEHTKYKANDEAFIKERYELNAKYRESKKSVYSINNGKERLNVVETNNYHKDSMHYQIEKNVYDDNGVPFDMKAYDDVLILNKDNVGNPLSIVTLSHLPNHTEVFMKTMSTFTYEYY
ncbi:MAG: hypothetical protein H6551_13475 [Chitinophagales bacterium]|nr:hypothetical protein [Chitinophagaceae bacterium]MCB9066144.1 hypothetical protein [Chitinophagales bacterium]